MKSIFTTLFCLTVIIFSFSVLKAQEQGFFLNNWEPKFIEFANYVPVTATTASPTVTVTIDASNTITRVGKNMYGQNAGVWNGSRVLLKDSFINNLKKLQPNVIRFPGGNMSNDYFWNAISKTDFPKDIPPFTPATMTLTVPGTKTFTFKDQYCGGNNKGWPLSLDSFYRILEKTKSTACFCVNYAYARYGTSAKPVNQAAHYAAEWVRYDKGRTKFWEIGNENYGNWETGYEIDPTQNKDNQPKLQTGALYGQHAAVFIDSMRKAAAEVGNDIKIGVVSYEKNSGTSVQINWNAGMMPNVAAKADFLIVHSYFTPYNENSTVATILNSATTVPKDIKTYTLNSLTSSTSITSMPVALTEWNIFAVGGSQSTSYINGMHATLVLGEIIKNKFAEATRWDLINGYQNGDSHGILTDEEKGYTPYSPRAPFYYIYFFQKMFGDTMVSTTEAGVKAETDSVESYASTFTSGQSGVVLVNKGKKQRTIALNFNNFTLGARFYYYLLTGLTDQTFSSYVAINGNNPTPRYWGPVDYDKLVPNAVDIVNGKVNITLPRYGTAFLVVDSKPASQTVTPLSQTISFGTLATKTMGDSDFSSGAIASSGLDVSLSSSNVNVATVSGTMIHLVGAGSCTITASQLGNTNFVAAVPISRTLTVLSITPTPTITYVVTATAGIGGTVSPASQTVISGSSTTVTATPSDNYIFIKWTNSDTSQSIATTPKILLPNIQKNESIVAIFKLKTGIDLMNNQTIMKVFPTFAKNFFTIESSIKLKTIEILTLNSMVVFKNTVNETVTEINVSELKSGTYIVKISTQKDIFTRRIIIVK